MLSSREFIYRSALFYLTLGLLPAWAKNEIGLQQIDNSAHNFESTVNLQVEENGNRLFSKYARGATAAKGLPCSSYQEIISRDPFGFRVRQQSLGQ